MEKLFETLKQRRRPEDVAQMIFECLAGQLDSDEERLLQRAARHSLKQSVYEYTSMLEDFAEPVGAQRQIARAEVLFNRAPHITEAQCDDPEVVEQFIRQVSQEIGKVFGRNDFKTDRLDHNARKAAHMEISRRRYNKLFRQLARMEDKLYTLLREIKKLEFQKIGKSGFASHLTWEEFSSDSNSACFIAYYTARRNLRSEFTNGKQQRAYDEIADMLFKRCQRDPQTNWWAIAHVYPREEVLLHLTDEQKGELLGRWYTTLQEIAALLKETWEHSRFDRRKMVVARGDDSSTWNNTAGAWNMARDHWIALVQSLQMDALLDEMCLGKVMRLMAADVVFWHFRTGGKLDPDTAVWSVLPLPWEVLAGEAICTRHTVEQACRKYKVDPLKSGWIAARPRTTVAAYRPTPELVHGVTVANPYLATVLRRSGVFSGKSVNLERLFSDIDKIV